jgi:hypothetical protein
LAARGLVVEEVGGGHGKLLAGCGIFEVDESVRDADRVESAYQVAAPLKAESFADSKSVVHAAGNSLAGLFIGDTRLGCHPSGEPLDADPGERRGVACTGSIAIGRETAGPSPAGWGPF